MLVLYSVKSFSLEGKKAVITGGTRGLCYDIAKAYHELGATLVLLSRGDGTAAAAALSTQAAPVHWIGCDVGDPAQASRAAEESLALLGGEIDILVNGAGIQYRAPALEFPFDRWQAVLDVNLTGTFLMSQAFGRVMCRQGHGRIINIASMCSFFGSVNIPAYSASKGGVAQLTKALSNEWASKGVNVNAIAPGYMETELTKDLREKNPTLYEEISARIPKGRWGRPEDLMGLAVFLAGDASEYVSGAVIPLDGGYLGK